MSDSLSGRLIQSSVYDVFCGLCPATHSDMQERLEFARTIRDAGWSKTRSKGWLCPKCVETKRVQR